MPPQDGELVMCAHPFFTLAFIGLAAARRRCRTSVELLYADRCEVKKSPLDQAQNAANTAAMTSIV